jgi:5'-3' exonuclease
MGIPFYFASLIRNHAGITRVVHNSFDVDVLGIDFNCLIHRYLQSDPIKSVLDALEHILGICRAKKVFIAFDGLVPYGKIVQQRYRRFRIKESEAFDKNQISPDTPYMRSLEEAIRVRFPHIELSPTQVPGEGEHKIFQEIKKLPEDERTSVCIYGLDADLILLSLFNNHLAVNMSLLRESGEFNDPTLKGAEFSLLDIQKLARQLPMEIEQYLILTVLCFGNDFMPNLGIFSLREDGYSRAMEYYNKSGKPDLTTENGRAIFLDYSASKETCVLKELVKLRKQPFERAVVGRSANCISIKYGLHILDGVTNMEPVVDAFWKTFHWTIYYFKTNEICNWNWVYPYPEAPLLQDIVQFYETELSPSELSYKVNDQLQVILPSKSLHAAKRRVKYPDEHYSETREPWMKKYEWEMKPRISIPWNPNASLTSVSPLQTQPLQS